MDVSKQKCHIKRKINKLYVKTIRLANHDREPIFENSAENKAINLKKIMKLSYIFYISSYILYNK